MSTKDQIIIPILNILAEKSIAQFIAQKDGLPICEDSLRVRDIIYRSDFTFRTRDMGWFFIEDDDAQRCLGNFTKYWLWVSEQKIIVPVNLIHIIGPGYPSQREMLNFLRMRAMNEYSNFKCELIYTDDWAKHEWQDELRMKLYSMLYKS